MELEIEINYEQFKYAAVKIKKDIYFISADLIITKNFILILEYLQDSDSFKVIHKIFIPNLLKLIPNRKKHSLKIFDKLISPEDGIELRTESYASILTLIDDIIQLRKTNKMNK